MKQEKETVFVYQFNWQTMKYSGKKEARPNPMDKGNYLLPANSTFVAPPAKGAENMVWDGSKWVAPKAEAEKKGTRRGRKRKPAPVKAGSTGGGSDGGDGGDDSSVD